MGLAGLLLVGLLAAPAPGAAEPATYEERRLARVLAVEGLEIDPAPNGKRVAFVRVVREDVFVPDEWIPTFFNAFHWLTDEDVVTREVRLAPGDPYDPERAAETERILRGLGIFALTRVVPVKTDEADTVGVLVYTRDLWSLRFEQSFQLTGGVLDSALLQLTERNLFGRDKQASARVFIAPLTFSVGEVYVDPRLLGGDLAFTQSFDVVFSRETGEAEGSRGAVLVGLPLRDLAQRWGFSVDGAFDVRVLRQIRGDQVLTFDDPSTAEVEAIPRVWDQRVFSGSLGFIHQAGSRFKHRLRAGAGAAFSDAEPNAETALPPENAAAFERFVLPRSRDAIFPFVSYAGFSPVWRDFEDLATFGQTEAVRLGPFWGVSLAAPLEALGSTEDSIVVTARLGTVAPVGADGLAELAVAGETRIEGRRRVDELLYVRARGATPTFALGRLVVRGDYVGRRRDLDGTLVTLGGDNGLRGFPSEALFGFGEDLLRTNAELRSPPLVWSFLHVGAVAFYDGGSVFPHLEALRWHHSVGVGLRGLLPQFNRTSYRLDVGFPLGEPGFSVLLTAGSGQAVPVTAIEDEDYGATYGGLPAQP